MIKHLLIIFFLCLALVIIWFKEGLLLGTAEAVLPFYNLERYFKMSEFAWHFHPGLGNLTGMTVASKPTYFILSLLQNMGIPGFVLQALTFLFILLSAGIGTFFLTKELFPRLPHKYFLFAPLFYLFNPISLVNVWSRFLPNFQFIYALLPVALFIFIRGLKRKNSDYALILALVTLFYSFAFSAVAFILLLWSILGLVTLFYVITSNDLKDRLFTISYFFIAVLAFLLTNIWYLSQLSNFTEPKTYSTNIRAFQSQETNITTLDTISQKLGNLTDLYRLSNNYFFHEYKLPWIDFYNSNFVILVSLITSIIVFYAIIKIRKQREGLLLGFLFFILLFLSKGSNPPLGFIYKEIFEKITFLQVFRNPIEKFSFALILVFSPLFSVGLFYLSKRISSKIITTLFIVIIFIWAVPFFNGNVFTNPTPPNNNPENGYKVKVPEYYKETNSYFENSGNNFRIIGLPIAEEGITYIWEKGYQGADIPSTLFSMPVIFFNTSVPFYYDLVKQIEPEISENNDFSKVANFLNVKFLFTRSDVDFNFRKLADPKKLDELLAKKEESGSLEKVAEFGKIKIWENKNWQDLTFYPATEVIATGEATLKNFRDLSYYQVLYEGSQFFNPQNQTPDVSYAKINPAHYRVKVENAQNPFVLVFSETYNYFWEASVNGQKINNHFRANIYGNGWVIEKTGNYEIEIIFKPQIWFDLAQKISAVSFLIILGHLILKRVLINK